MRTRGSIIVLALCFALSLAAPPVVADVTPPASKSHEIPACPGHRKTRTVDEILSLARRRFTAKQSIDSMDGGFVRGVLRFNGEVCTAGVPPYCTGRLSLTPGPGVIDQAHLISIDGTRVGLPARCGMTEAAGPSPATSDCAPGLLDHEIEVHGTLRYNHNFEPRATLIIDSVCRR